MDVRCGVIVAGVGAVRGSHVGSVRLARSWLTLARSKVTDSYARPRRATSIGADRKKLGRRQISGEGKHIGGEEGGRKKNEREKERKKRRERNF